MPYYHPDSPEYKAYNEGWNGQRLGNAGAERPYYTRPDLQALVERGHADSKANHGFGRWSISEAAE